MSEPDEDEVDQLDAEEGEPAEGDEWIVAQWFVSYEVRLGAIYNNKGKPGKDWCETHRVHEMYRWKSYHAARKWLKENPKRVGYVVLNISELERHSDTWHRHNYRSLYKEGGGPLA